MERNQMQLYCLLALPYPQKDFTAIVTVLQILQ
jgi:hypothetical protein